ncbi:recombinase family protein [Chloroflexota bacterium]
MDNEVVAYTRVSTLEQTKGVSIEAQLDRLRSYAKFQEWTIVDEFIDAGWSGKDDNRPGLRRLMASCRNGGIGTVVVCKIDRLMRNARLLLGCVDEFKKLGIRFIAIDDNVDTGESKTGQLMLTILAAVAEWERERIGERVAEGRQYRISQGRWPSGRTLYGYRWFPEDQRWETVDEEAEVVKDIYELYVKENLGVMKIPIRLNEESKITRSGSKWRLSSVYRILTHPGYKGEHPTGIKMPVIIDEATWELAQQKRLRARSVRRIVKDWLLQGMCICGECGHILSCLQKDATEKRYYGCHGRYKDVHLDGSPRCQLPRLKADWLEEVVWERLKGVLSDSEKLHQGIKDALTELKERKEDYGGQTASVDKQLEAIRLKKERLGLVFTDGTIGKDVYEGRLQGFRKQEKELLKIKNNLSPEARLEIAELENSIKMIEEILGNSSRNISVTDFGIFGRQGDTIAQLGYNPWSETEGKSEIGQVRETDYVYIEGTDLKMQSINPPEGFWSSENKGEVIKDNIRSLLQNVNIKVYVFKDRIEVRGLIPTETISLSSKTKRERGELIIPSVRGRG